MESIIEFNEGYKPNSKTKCFFCDNEASLLFGMVNINKTIEPEKYVMKSACMCLEHAEAFNTLLSGENDVNELVKIYKQQNTSKINLRRV